MNLDRPICAPRCRHGHIILGCPDDECPEQSAYLERHNAAIDAMYERQWQEARRVVREMLNLDGER